MLKEMVATLPRPQNRLSQQQQQQQQQQHQQLQQDQLITSNNYYQKRPIQHQQVQQNYYQNQNYRQIQGQNQGLMPNQRLIIQKQQPQPFNPQINVHHQPQPLRPVNQPLKHEPMHEIDFVKKNDPLQGFLDCVQDVDLAEPLETDFDPPPTESRQIFQIHNQNIQNQRQSYLAESQAPMELYQQVKQNQQPMLNSPKKRKISGVNKPHLETPKTKKPRKPSGKMVQNKMRKQHQVVIVQQQQQPQPPQQNHIIITESGQQRIVQGNIHPAPSLQNFVKPSQIEPETPHVSEDPKTTTLDEICKICGKGFDRKDKLLLHQVIHSEERPYTCVICSRGFKRQDKLKRHLNTVHKDRPDAVAHAEQQMKIQHEDIMKKRREIATHEARLELVESEPSNISIPNVKNEKQNFVQAAVTNPQYVVQEPRVSVQTIIQEGPVLEKKKNKVVKKKKKTSGDKVLHQAQQQPIQGQPVMVNQYTEGTQFFQQCITETGETVLIPVQQGYQQGTTTYWGRFFKVLNFLY